MGIFFYIILIVLVICAVIAYYFEIHKEKQYGCIAILTLCLVITAVQGFKVTNESTRMQTSMDFCLSTYSMFQSKEFVQKERFICSGLLQRGDNYCAIEEIDNDTLRDAVYEYCEIMNGVGVLVYKHMIEPDVVVAYLGANTLMTFQLIKPYLDLTRKARYENVPMELPEYERELIQKAQSLTFAHFELLALEIKHQAPDLIDEYEKELQVQNKRSHKNNKKK